ncbi:MAG: RDD family protein [Streptococcaceae bacterium]|jgi:uncharacterized RDD family membrane protein YckC|nr:RDD family protein [Streptococcaceae bacterium]
MIASLKKRFFSIFIDWLVIFAFVLCLLGFTLLFYLLILQKIPVFNEWQENLVSFLTLIFPVFLYFVISESSEAHASIGKRKAGLVVASTTGELHMWQIIVRNILKLLPWQVAHLAIFNIIANHSEPTPFFYISIIFVYVFPIVNIAVMVIRKDRRSLHDLIAKTIVLKKCV